MKSKLYLIFLLITFFTSCRDESMEYQLINQAERLLETKPDSAYLLLDSITMADNLSNKLLARWCMLYGKAADKMHEDMPYVSQLLRARTWFEKHGNSSEQAQIGLFLGRSYVEDREYMKAMDAYMQALEVAEKAKKYDLAGYINSYMGDLYTLKGLTKEALNKYNYAANCFLKANNKRSYALGLNFIARTLAFEDSCSLALALRYLLEADSIVTRLQDADAISAIANGLGNIYNIMGYPDKAEAYFLKSLEANQADKASTQLALTDLYMNIGDFEKARFYLNECKRSSQSQETYLGSLFAEYEIERKSNHVELALYNLEQYVEKLDSLYEVTANLDILDAEKRYDHVIILNENAKLHNSNLINIIITIVLIIIGLIIYIIFLNKNKKKNQKLHEHEIKLKDNEEMILKLSFELEKKKNEIILQTSVEKNEKRLSLLKDELLEIENELNLLRKEKIQSSSIAKKIIKLSSKIIPGQKGSLLSDKDWNNLFSLIDQTYISFSHFMSENKYGLSPAEKQYCYLSFLELDIIAESILLNINRDSVSTRRLRVRQKLDCKGKNISLHQFFTSI